MKNLLFIAAITFNLSAIAQLKSTSGTNSGKSRNTPITTPTSPSSPTTSPSIGSTIGGILNSGANSTSSSNSTTANFTQTEAATAIKEALMKGITTGVAKVATTDGYFGNSFIKIPFPQDAQVIASTLQMVGAGELVNKVVLQINRSAEQAAKDATPIFVNSIKQMTLNDAINIVSNQQPDAATRFLQRTTTDQLVASFRPKIKSALDKTQTTNLWKQVMSTYNKVPFVQKINPDLTDFVTRKALDGLFYMVAQEEAKIRKDPMARTSDILTKVFGGILK